MNNCIVNWQLFYIYRIGWCWTWWWWQHYQRKTKRCKSKGQLHALWKLFYRPQRSCGKVMFLHLSIILFTGGCLPYPSPLGQTPPPVQCMLGYGQHTGGTHSTGMQSCLSGPLCFVGFTMQLPNRTGFTTIWRIKCTTFQFRLLQGEFMDGLVPSVTQVTSQPRLGQIQRRINELCNYQR